MNIPLTYDQYRADQNMRTMRTIIAMETGSLSFYKNMQAMWDHRLWVFITRRDSYAPKIAYLERCITRDLSQMIGWASR